MGAPVRPASNSTNIAASTAENQGNGAQRSDDF
jgi:hypothetical protein